jgi:hypothetical protein
MQDDKMLDAILLPLADLYEHGNRHWQPIDPSSLEEYEPLRELLARLRADRFVVARAPIGKSGPYQLTANGYAHFKDRIKALRVLS